MWSSLMVNETGYENLKKFLQEVVDWTKFKTSELHCIMYCESWGKGWSWMKNDEWRDEATLYFNRILDSKEFTFRFSPPADLDSWTIVCTRNKANRASELKLTECLSCSRQTRCSF